MDVFLSMEIPRSGVVGHNHAGGNTNILTYDFTSSDQNVVFRYHYPELLNEWFLGILFDFMVYLINQCNSLKKAGYILNVLTF